MTFEKILCPVDFSDCSNLALDYTLAIAAEQGAMVSVMHVLPEVLSEHYPYLAEPMVPTDESRERALEQLGRFVHRARARKVTTDVILEDGEVVEEVLKRAEALPADLVVMGTHGRRGFTRLLLGSVTERILRRSKAPVLSVGAGARGPREAGATFQRVLCPIDFSPASLRGLELARALVAEPKDLTVLHVIELYMDPSAFEAIPFDLDELEERHREGAEKKLAEALPEELRDGARVETVVLRSPGAYKEILRRAGAEEHDLIVMGVAGRGSADLFFFGSTTNHVVRAATCPVLTVRAGE